MTWLHKNREVDPPTRSNCDRVIDEGYRRRGYAEGTVGAIETVAGEMGLRSLGTHVFTHNPGAVHLDRKLGYTIRSMNAFKHPV